MAIVDGKEVDTAIRGLLNFRNWGHAASDFNPFTNKNGPATLVHVSCDAPRSSMPRINMFARLFRSLLTQVLKPG